MATGLPLLVTCTGSFWLFNRTSPKRFFASFAVNISIMASLLSSVLAIIAESDVIMYAIFGDVNSFASSNGIIRREISPVFAVFPKIFQ
jgi:hypothetical protein